MINMKEMEQVSAVKVAVLAAAYTGLTLAISPIAYGPIQFRISDAMLILPFHKRFGKSAVIGLTIGGFFANLASPYIPWDLIVGPIVNLLACLIMFILGGLVRKFSFGQMKATAIACLGAVIGSLIIALVVAYEIVVLELAYFAPDVYFVVASLVFIGELVSFVLGGTLLLIALQRAMP